jgi:hypothetical protein
MGGRHLRADAAWLDHPANAKEAELYPREPLLFGTECVVL